MNPYLLSSLLLRHLCVFKFLHYELRATWVTNKSKFFFTSTPYTVDAQYMLVNLNESSEQGNSRVYISAPWTETRPWRQTRVIQPPGFWEWLPPRIGRRGLHKTLSDSSHIAFPTHHSHLYPLPLELTPYILAIKETLLKAKEVLSGSGCCLLITI